MNPTPGNIELFWLNESTKCYYKDNIVCVLIPKNACTFYRELLGHNEWNSLQFKDINWKENHVFGFIQDPVVRYCKGLTEDLHGDLDLSGKIISLLSDNIENCLPLTYHTEPISIICGDRMHEMTWLSLDSDISSKQQLDEFCGKHKLFLDWNVNCSKNSSDSKKINFYKNIKFLLGNANRIFWRMFAKDIDLYNKVIYNQKKK